MNQCDGCMSGIPVIDGIHTFSNGDMMVCCKERYTEDTEVLVKQTDSPTPLNLSLTGEYQQRDIIGLDEAGGFYSKHTAAITSEKLHYKSAIAAELGWRDYRIHLLQKLLRKQAEVSQRDQKAILELINKEEERYARSSN